MAMDVSTLSIEVESKGISDSSNQLDQLTTSAGNAEDSVKKFSSTVQQESTAASNALAMVSDSINSITKLLSIDFSFAGMKNLAHDAMDAADAYTLMGNRLLALSGNAETAAENQQMLLDMALKLHVSAESLTTVYSRLSIGMSELGYNTDDVAKVTASLAAAMQVGGATTAEANGALLQFSHAITQGKLNAREFNSVMGAAPMLMEMIANTANVSFGKLREEISKGTITTQTLVKALEDNNAQLTNMAANAPLTFGKAFQDMSTHVEVFIGQLNKVTGASTAITGAMEYVGNHIEDIAKIVGTVLAGAMMYYAVTAAPAAIAATLGFATTALSTVGAVLGLTTATEGLAAVMAVLDLVNPFALAAAAVAAATAAVVFFSSTTTTAMDDVKKKIDEINSQNWTIDQKAAAFNDAIAEQQKLLDEATAKMKDLQAQKEKSYDAIDIQDFNEQIAKQKGLIDNSTEAIKKFQAQATQAETEIASHAFDKQIAKVQEETSVLEEEIKTKQKMTQAEKELFLAKQAQLDISDKATAKAHQELVDLTARKALAEDLFKSQEDARKKSEASAKSLENSYNSLRTSVENLLAKHQEELDSGQKLNSYQAEASKITAELADKFTNLSAAHRQWLTQKAQELQSIGDQQEYLKLQQDLLTAQDKLNLQAEITNEELVKRSDTQAINNLATQEAIDKATDELTAITKSAEAEAKRNLVKEQSIIAIKEQTLLEEQLLLVAQEGIPEFEKANAQLEKKIAMDQADIQGMKDKLPLLQKMVDIGKEKDLKATTDEIGKLLTDSLFQSFENGRSFANNFWDNLKNLFKQQLTLQISAQISQSLLSTLTGGQSGPGGTVAGALGGGIGGLGNLFSAASNLYSTLSSGGGSVTSMFANFATSGIGQKLGLSGITDASAAAGFNMPALTNLGQSISDIASVATNFISWGSVAVDAFKSFQTGKGWGNTVGAAIGTYLLPGIGTMIGSFLGSAIDKAFGGGGPKQGGSAISTGGTIYGSGNTEHQADTQMMQTVTALQTNLNSMITKLGGTLGASVGLGFSTDPQGTAQTQVTQLVKNALGQTVVSTTHEDVGRDQASLNAALQLESKRVMLEALQASNLPKEYAAAFNNVDLTKVTSDQADAILNQINAIQALKAAFDSLSDVMPQLSNLTYDAMNNIATLSGGVQQFGTNLQAYYKDFYSATEQTANATKQLQEQFTNLGVSMPATRDDFRKLVEAQDLTTASGQAMYAALLQIAPAFAAVVPAATTAAASVTTLVSNVKTLQSGIDSLGAFMSKVGTDINTMMVDMGSKSQMDVLTSNLNDAQAAFSNVMSSGTASASDIVSAGDAYRQSLMDRYALEKTQADDATKGLQAMTTAAQNFSAFAQQMANYAASLLTGPLAPGSMEDQLAAAKAQYQQTLAAARAGDTEAQKNLQSQADTYLKLGQSYYASGQGYTDIFSQVSGDISGLAGSAQGSATAIAQQQVAATNQITATLTAQQKDTLDQLQAINDATKAAQDKLANQVPDLLTQIAGGITGPDGLTTIMSQLPTNLATELQTIYTAMQKASTPPSTIVPVAGVPPTTPPKATTPIQQPITGGTPTITDPNALGQVIGFHPQTDVPYYADGGVVGKGTLAVVGEAGPEAIIPLKGGAVPVAINWGTGGSNSDMIAELQALRAEVAAMNEQQTQQNQSAMMQQAAMHKESQETLNAQVNSTKQVVNAVSDGGRR